MGARAHAQAHTRKRTQTRTQPRTRARGRMAKGTATAPHRRPHRAAQQVSQQVAQQPAQPEALKAGAGAIFLVLDALSRFGAGPAYCPFIWNTETFGRWHHDSTTVLGRIYLQHAAASRRNRRTASRRNSRRLARRNSSRLASRNSQSDSQKEQPEGIAGEDHEPDER